MWFTDTKFPIVPIFNALIVCLILFILSACVICALKVKPNTSYSYEDYLLHYLMKDDVYIF